MIEKPAAIVEPGIGHAIAGVQASERDARRQGARSVMQGELVGRVAALDGTRLEQAFAQAQHRRGDRQAFGFVCIEQRIGSAADDVRELPAQVVGILHARVESLASCRWMHVRRIPRQEHAPDAVTIDHARRRLVDRIPRDALDAMARDLVHRRLDARCRGLCFANELEQRRIRQRAEPDGAAFGEGPDMPVAAIESFDLDVRDEHRLLVDRLAFQPQAKRFSHRTVAAVAADQEIRSHRFAGRKCGVHSALILRERRQRLAEFDLAAQRPQALAQDCFRARLRHHPEVGIRHALGRLPG